MGAQRRQRGKPQHTGPHLRFSGRAGRRSAWFSLLPFCQTASAFRLICLFHTFCRRGVYRVMVFAPLRRPNLFRFPFACLRAAPSSCFAHLFVNALFHHYPICLFVGRSFRLFCSSHISSAELSASSYRCKTRYASLQLFDKLFYFVVSFKYRLSAICKILYW